MNRLFYSLVWLIITLLLFIVTLWISFSVNHYHVQSEYAYIVPDHITVFSPDEATVDTVFAKEWQSVQQDQRIMQLRGGNSASQLKAINSPTNGTVTNILVNANEPVTRQQPLAEIRLNTIKQINAFFSQQAAEKLFIGQSTTVCDMTDYRNCIQAIITDINLQDRVTADDTSTLKSKHSQKNPNNDSLITLQPERLNQQQRENFKPGIPVVVKIS